MDNLKANSFLETEKIGRLMQKYAIPALFRCS